MNQKGILIISLLICVIFSISAVSAADVDVNDTDDTILTTQEDTDVVAQSNDLSSYPLSNTNEIMLGDGETGSFKDLQNLIGNDTTGTITLDKNYTYNADTDSDLIVTGVTVADKIIQGNGQNIVIDGKGASRLFMLSGTVTLKGITFINGYSSMTSAIYSTATLTVSDCTFINNTGLNGGVLQSAGSLTRRVVHL